MWLARAGGYAANMCNKSKVISTNPPKVIDFFQRFLSIYPVLLTDKDRPVLCEYIYKVYRAKVPTIHFETTGQT